MSAKNYPPVASQRKWSRILGCDYTTIWRNVKAGKIQAERAPDGTVQITLGINSKLGEIKAGSWKIRENCRL